MCVSHSCSFIDTTVIEMELLFIHILALSLVYCLTTEAVNESRTEELADLEEFQIFHHLALSYSSIKNFTDMISLKRSTPNSAYDKIIISQTLKKLSTDMKLYLNIFSTNVIREEYSWSLPDKIEILMEDIDGILEKCSTIIERPSETNSTEIMDLMTSLEFINVRMTLYQPCCTWDMMTCMTTALNLENQYAYCVEKTSSHQTLFYITKNLIELELTVFAVLKFFHPQNSNSIENRNSFHVNNYFPMTRRIKSYILSASKLMSEWPNVVYSCDVKNYVSDTNYIELEGLIQPVFVSAYGLESCAVANAHKNVHGCNEYLDLPMAKKATNRNLILPAGCDGYYQHVFLPLSSERPCYGYLTDCSSYESKEVCRNPGGSKKRYSWYKINGRLFGKEDSCPTGRQEASENWGIQNSPLLRHCQCTCVDNGRQSPSTHRLSLDWSFSDVKENKIVIGIKFTRVKEMISLQIKQGILIQEGRILPNSEEWKAPPSITELDVRKYYLWGNTFGDMRFIALDEYTALDLDDVMVDPGYLITGVKLYEVKDNSIKLMIHQTKFDWRTGNLENDVTNEIVHASSNKEQLHIPLMNPIYARYPGVLREPSNGNVEVSTPNTHYIKFKESLRWRDGGSRTLPFFDAQNVEIEPGSPLIGIGLYYRGASESAGLISMKLFGLNYTDILVDFEKKWLNFFQLSNLVNI